MRKITDKIREKKRLWLSRGLLFISLFLLFALVSCEIFNQSTRWYLRYYSENAFIGDIKVEDIAGYYSGVTCIDSNSDKVIKLIMMNPQEYDLYAYTEVDSEVGIKFDDSRMDVYASHIIFNQDSNDKTLCSITFRKEFLELIEKGTFPELDSDNNPTGRVQKNISCTVTLFNGFTRVEPFHISLYVNSEPPRIQGAMFQKVDDKYVVCFNIPDIHNTVHEKDTKDLTVGGEHFKIDYSSTNPVIRDMDGNIAQNLTTTNPGSALVDIDGATTAFIPLIGCTQFYYYTDIRPGDSSDEIKYKITLTDDYKFTKEVTVSSQMAKLDRPSIDISGPIYVSELDGKFNLTINHDGGATYKGPDGVINTKHCPSPVIEYEIYKKDGDLLKRGSGRAPVTIPLEKGKYYVYAYAQAEGYADGDSMEGSGTTPETSFTVKPNTTYYVKAGSSTGNGSKNSPYNSIQHCVNEIKADAKDYGYETSGYTIELLSDIKAIETDEFTQTSESLISFTRISELSDLNFKYTINGNGHKIDADKKGNVIWVYDYTDVILNNVTLTGGYFPGKSGGGIHVGGDYSSLKMNGGSIINNVAWSGGGIYSQSKSEIYLNGVSITGNHVIEVVNPCRGGGICLATKNIDGEIIVGKLTLLGNCNITGNTQGENNAPSNVYLVDGALITIVSESDGETNYPAFSGTVGFTTEKTPEIGDPIQITKNFTKYKAQNVSPFTAFIPDDSSKGCIMYNEDDKEVYLSASVSSFVTYDGESLSVFCADNVNTGGTVTLTVKDKNDNDITSECAFTNHILMYMSSPLDNSGNRYFTTGGTYNNSITLKNTVTEKGVGYALYVQITYKGFTYDATLPFKLN